MWNLELESSHVPMRSPADPAHGHIKTAQALEQRLPGPVSLEQFNQYILIKELSMNKSVKHRCSLIGTFHLGL